MRSLRVEKQSYKANNKRLIKAQEYQNQLNTNILHILTDIQRKMNSGDWTINPEGSKNTARRRKRSPSESYDSEGSTGDSSSYSHENQRRRCYQNHSRDEFKKARTPTFNGEVKTGQEAEAWLPRMKKYFQVQYYSGNMKARVSIFDLNGRASIWWEHLK